jgi:hypothetical protein
VWVTQLLDWCTDYLKKILFFFFFFFFYSFIHLAHYMMLRLLHVLSQNSLEDMVIALSTHYCFLPSDRCMRTFETCKKLEDPRPIEAPQVRVKCLKKIVEGLS